MRTEKLGKHAKTRLKNCLPVACKFWEVDVEDVKSSTRKRKIMNAKHSLRYHLSIYNDLTLAEIGELTNCDHSNVVHSIKTFNELCEYDEDFRAYKRIIVKEKVKYEEHTLNGKLKKIIRLLAPASRKIELIKKVFENESR